jgi:uncharacterized protein
MNQTQLALVTGASSGIGFELAGQFAEHGYDLIVTAEDDGINTVPNRLADYNSHIEPIQVDLRTRDGVEYLYAGAIAGGRSLSAVALNAGIGRGDSFLNSELADDLSIVDLNVRATVHLAKLVLRDMANRNEGKVLFTSSVASMIPGSYQSVYHASKSFVQSFAEGLRDELRDTSITVTALMPGPTETSFFHRAKMDDTRVGKASKDDPALVARQGFQALMRGDQKVVGGGLNSKLVGTASRVLPDRVKAFTNRIISRPLDR